MGIGALRNQPCPCHSGEKFKKCCGSPERSIDTATGMGINVSLARRVISPKECLAVVASLRSSLKHFGVSLPSNCELAHMISELEGLATAAATKAPFDRRALEAFQFIDQPARIASTLENLKRVPVPKEKLRILRKRVDRLASLDFEGQAQDTLLELEVAGRLAQAGLSVEFTEPDIVVALKTGRVSLACKRPRTRTGVVRRLEEGASQIKDCGRPGIIVLSLEPLLHTKPGGTRPVQWVARTREELAARGRRRFEALIDTLTPDGRASAGRFAQVIGVLWLGFVTGFVREPPSYTRDWFCLAMQNKLYTGAYGPLSRIARSLFRGGPA